MSEAAVNLAGNRFVVFGVFVQWHLVLRGIYASLPARVASALEHAWHDVSALYYC